MTRLQMIQASKQFITAEDLSDPKTIQVHTLSRVDKETLIDSAGGYYIADFCWPIEVHGKLTVILTERAKLKKALDDSMGLVYQLGNAISRGEIT